MSNQRSAVKTESCHLKTNSGWQFSFGQHLNCLNCFFDRGFFRASGGHYGFMAVRAFGRDAVKLGENVNDARPAVRAEKFNSNDIGEIDEMYRLGCHGRSSE